MALGAGQLDHMVSALRRGCSLEDLHPKSVSRTQNEAVQTKGLKHTESTSWIPSQQPGKGRCMAGLIDAQSISVTYDQVSLKPKLGHRLSQHSR